MAITKWKILKEEDISPSPWFPLFKQTALLQDGTQIDDYYLARLGNVSMVIPITPNKEIIFVRQYKNGVAEITLELPAGFLEKDQSALQAAQHELEQETGIKCNHLQFVGELWAMPTKTDIRVFGYIATDVVFNSKQDLDRTENIEIVPVSIEHELEDFIVSGKINCSDSLALLFLAKLKFPQLLQTKS